MHGRYMSFLTWSKSLLGMWMHGFARRNGRHTGRLHCETIFNTPYLYVGLWHIVCPPNLSKYSALALSCVIELSVLSKNSVDYFIWFVG
jgi:hypothetical protein